MQIHQPFNPRVPTQERFTFYPQPFDVDELIRMGVDRSDACMIVWPVTDEAFAEYAAQRRSVR